MNDLQHKPGHRDTADHEILGDLNRGFIRSVGTSDAAWFERNLADDFVNSNADGTLVERAAFLRQVAQPCPVSDLAVEDVRIRLFGATAIIHGRTTYRKPDGTAAAGRYTDVWVRHGGRWVCVSGDVTRG